MDARDAALLHLAAVAAANDGPAETAAADDVDSALMLLAATAGSGETTAAVKMGVIGVFWRLHQQDGHVGQPAQLSLQFSVSRSSFLTYCTNFKGRLLQVILSLLCGTTYTHRKTHHGDHMCLLFS